MNKKLGSVRDFFLIIFVITVNFEAWSPFGLEGITSIARITAFLYLISCLPFLKTMQMKPLKRYLLPLIGFFFIEFFSSVINNVYVDSVISAIDLRLIQMLILLVFIADHLRRNPRLVKSVLNTFIVSVLLMSILSYRGIGVSIDLLKDKGRLSLFGENPNMIGMKAAFAVLMACYIILAEKEKRWFRQLGYVIVLIPLIYLLIQTASRGALLSVFVGLFLVIFLQKIAIKRKIILGILGVAASFWLFSYIMRTDESFNRRILLTLETGNTGRNDIWNAAYDIIENNFIIGVGSSGELPVMQTYLGKASDTHNVFLFVLVTTGVIGFVFFMTFMLRLGYDLYKKYQYDKNVLYLVLFFVLILNMAKAGGFINRTFLWFFLALLIGIIRGDNNRTPSKIKATLKSRRDYSKDSKKVAG